jgi:predicted PurR-regulated permease PerM
LLVGQAIVLKDNLQAVAVTPGTSLYDETGNVITGINSLLAPLGNDAVINDDSVQKFVNELLPNLISMMIAAVVNIAGNVAQLFTAAIVYTFMFMAFLRYNKSIVNFVKSMIPFNESIRDKYVEKSALIVTASLKGQFVISFVTAISSSLLLFVLGLQEFFFFFLVLFTLLGMVPLGSGIVMIPVAIVAMLTGSFWPGFWVLAIYLLVICNIDSVLRPRLIPKKANIIPALTTLATFCGIYYFGILGIVYGPLIVIVLSTTSEIYLASRKASVV